MSKSKDIDRLNDHIAKQDKRLKAMEALLLAQGQRLEGIEEALRAQETNEARMEGKLDMMPSYLQAIDNRLGQMVTAKKANGGTKNKG